MVTCRGLWSWSFCCSISFRTLIQNLNYMEEFMYNLFSTIPLGVQFLSWDMNQNLWSSLTMQIPRVYHEVPYLEPLEMWLSHWDSDAYFWLTTTGLSALRSVPNWHIIPYCLMAQMLKSSFLNFPLPDALASTEQLLKIN